MKFYIVDESNVSKDDKFDFLVYGGLVVDASEMRVLAKGVMEIKKKFGLNRERPIKWANIKWGGEVFDEVKFAAIKEEILGLVKKSNCKVIIYLAPQDFYHEPSILSLGKMRIDSAKHLKAQQFALNASLNRFNLYLGSVKDVGMVLADSFVDIHKPELTSHCLALYPDGVDHPDGIKRPLDLIVYPVVQVNNEHSEVHQINDVVLGSITFSLREMAKNFLPEIRDLFWGAEKGIYSAIIGNGINIYPKNKNDPAISAKVEKLTAKLLRLISV